MTEGEMVLSTPGAEDIIVSLSGEVDKKKAFFETFETGFKNGYAEAEVTCVAAQWRMAQTLIGNLADDRKTVIGACVCRPNPVSRQNWR